MVCGGPDSKSPGEIVELSSLEPDDLDPLWSLETGLWHQKLYWDTSRALGILRAAMERKSLLGRAATDHRRVLGYGTFTIEGHRAVLGNLLLSPKTHPSVVGEPLLDALVRAVKAERSITRIETQFVCFSPPWMRELLIAHGFRVCERVFLRRPLTGVPERWATDRDILLEGWHPSYMDEAAVVMRQAHQGGVDAEMSELYRTGLGCRILLHNILDLRGCGDPIPFASTVARDRATGALEGLVLATEISKGHAHLAQVAVRPCAQGRGLGRLVAVESLAALAQSGFRTVSLMVSGENQVAFSLYDSLGFEGIHRFPVFSWDAPAVRAPYSL